MIKGEKLYYEIQQGGIIRIENIAKKVLSDIKANFQLPAFPPKMNSINQIYFLIENGWYPYIREILLKNNYSLEVELQYAISVIMYMDKTHNLDAAIKSIGNFSSITSTNYSNGMYSFNTICGRVNAMPLNKYIKDNNILRFSMADNFRGYCHEGVRSFITYFPNYKAITSLIPNQFNERQYHTYIELEDGYVDFANNMYLPKKDFEAVMKPEILSEVYGHQLDCKLLNLENSGLLVSKSPIVRIAVDEQIKRTK